MEYITDAARRGGNGPGNADLLIGRVAYRAIAQPNQFHLPTEADLTAVIRRELALIDIPESSPQKMRRARKGC